jgi:hypothetical protein
MKKKVANLIKILGITVNEIVIDIEVGDYKINSLEWIPETDKVILHIWFEVEDEEGEYEYDVDFEILSAVDQKQIYTILSKYCMN